MITHSKILSHTRLAVRGAGICLFLAGAPGAATALTYDSFGTGGYTLADYQAKWSNPYGLGEMAINDTRDFSTGSFRISALPFQTAYDFSVFDHIKYLGVSTQSFAVPAGGTLTFSSTIQARTVGTQPGRIINGTNVQSGLPYAAPTLEGQQAAAVMNMIDFKTGQLFDWFVSGSTAFTLIERLPSSVTNPALPSSDPSYVGIDKMYTQIIDEVPIGPGPQNVAITYGRGDGVVFTLNGTVVSHINNVGIPLDKQGVPYSGIYPSYGPGELLASKIDSFSIGHGLFSLLDAFPFQHSDRPDLSVSISVANRAFGQGIAATFDDFNVLAVPEPSTWAVTAAGFALLAALRRRRAVTPSEGAISCSGPVSKLLQSPRGSGSNSTPCTALMPENGGSHA